MRAGPSRIMGPVSRRTLLPWLLVVALAAFVGGRSLDSGGEGGEGAADQPLPATVVRVVDGDTIVVRLPGDREERVRYIGVDTPESVKPGTPVQCFAHAASAENERLVEGRRVRLVRDAEERDRYGRLLAYVYRLPDGLFVNAELVRGGFARPLTIPPNVRFADRFAVLAREAREAARGLWSRC
jgi:micrococcal nuclease